jgi:pSer/pThr/pTyr-binding forkhead associated (FHA) protein
MLSERDYSHILILIDDQGQREFVLTEPLYSIGRNLQCDIRLVSQFVSRYHATLVQVPNEDESFSYTIVDGDGKGKPSANGLLINGRKLQACKLVHEDSIIFGPTVSAVYYQRRRNDDDPFSDNQPSPVGRGGGDPDGLAMAET